MMHVSRRGPTSHEEATGLQNWRRPYRAGNHRADDSSWSQNPRLECAPVHLQGLEVSLELNVPTRPSSSRKPPNKGDSMVMTDIPESQWLLSKGCLSTCGPMASVFLGRSLEQGGVRAATVTFAQPIATREKRTILMMDSSVFRRPLSAEPAGKLRGGAGRKGAGGPGGLYPIITRTG